MTRPRNREFFTLTLLLSLILVFCLATATVSPAQSSLTTLVTFDGSNGAIPLTVLTQGVDGNLYGTTYGGCFSSCGTVFVMTPAGTLTTLYNFCSATECSDGAEPLGSLVQASNGDFYGVTEGGGAHGAGTIFKITPSGKMTTLYSFCALANCVDGQLPGAGLIQATNGNLYGTTRSGGFNGGGTVYEVTLTGKLTTIYSFCSLFDCADGDNPLSPLTQAKNGNFYGETAGVLFGTIFEITPNGKLTTLHTFSGTDGNYPTGGLIQASNGNFYGVTVYGGASSNSECSAGCGTIFKINASGKLSTLYSFCGPATDCMEGALPWGALVQGTDGNLYGTTYGNQEGNLISDGTVFQITPEGTLTNLYTFCALGNCADGDGPQAGLTQATNGTFYGTTSGLEAPGDGTIFSLSTSLGPFVKTQPTSAKEGAKIGIFGQGFDNSSVVQFGGVPATNVKPSGSTFLFVTVPAGALTGSVTVTTNGTTLTSNQQFRVKPQLLSFNPPSGPVGTQVTITGVGFTQTNGVGFGDNVPAEFTVNSDMEVTATVPAGAKTGPIGVVTRGGTAISSAIFTVN